MIARLGAGMIIEHLQAADPQRHQHEALHRRDLAQLVNPHLDQTQYAFTAEQTGIEIRLALLEQLVLEQHAFLLQSSYHQRIESHVQQRHHLGGVKSMAATGHQQQFAASGMRRDRIAHQLAGAQSLTQQQRAIFLLIDTFVDAPIAIASRAIAG